MNYLNQIRKPKIRNKELIALDLTSEHMELNTDCQLFRAKPSNSSSKIDRSVYNRRKRRFFSFRKLLRKVIVVKLNQYQDCYIVDSGILLIS